MIKFCKTIGSRRFRHFITVFGYAAIYRNSEKIHFKEIIMLAEQILAINVTTRKLCKNCDNGAIISQKMRLLYLVRNDVLSPKELVNELCIAKPNLTILARDMIADGLIEKMRVERDLRSVHYKITDKGTVELNNMIAQLNESVAKQLGLNDKEVQKGEKKLETAIDFLNGIE